MAGSFAGMLIILRPGARILDPGSLYTLAGAVCIAANMLMIVSLHKTDSSNAIVLYNALLMLPMSLAVALFFWRLPTWTELGGLLITGCLALGVQQCVTRAFGGGQATPILPLDFTRLIFAAALGFFVFGEKVDLWTWVGGAVTFACTVLLVRTEPKPRLHLGH
ncbi:MAG: DMT family transporter [Desulfarculaceae bacterium]|nr:DMT family transporter [Desulfarculaceae bacterium]MCF8071975.1 DMT family transporter [Desulfarculaceae bacterium]MCF8101492.1 DMT family transporter [Desulfarculaceae bacterium]MCF8115042.1 DMT family transporter [Desulfarculaceae bacterium]